MQMQRKSYLFIFIQLLTYKLRANHEIFGGYKQLSKNLYKNRFLLYMLIFKKKIVGGNKQLSKKL